MRPGRSSRSRDRQFTPELVERILEVARDVQSPMIDDLRALCDHEPREFERVIRTTEGGRHLLALTDLKERDPEVYEFRMGELHAELQVTSIAEQIALARQEGDVEREKTLRSQLQMHARMQIVHSLAARGIYLNRLQQHLDALREELDQDGRNFDANVERRIAEALREAERAVGASAAAQRRTR